LEAQTVAVAPAAFQRLPMAPESVQASAELPQRAPIEEPALAPTLWPRLVSVLFSRVRAQPPVSVQVPALRARGESRSAPYRPGYSLLPGQNRRDENMTGREDKGKKAKRICACEFSFSSIS